MRAVFATIGFLAISIQTVLAENGDYAIEEPAKPYQFQTDLFKQIVSAMSEQPTLGHCGVNASIKGDSLVLQVKEAGKINEFQIDPGTTVKAAPEWDQPSVLTSKQGVLMDLVEGDPNIKVQKNRLIEFTLDRYLALSSFRVSEEVIRRLDYLGSEGGRAVYADMPTGSVPANLAINLECGTR